MKKRVQFNSEKMKKNEKIIGETLQFVVLLKDSSTCSLPLTSIYARKASLAYGWDGEIY